MNKLTEMVKALKGLFRSIHLLESLKKADAPDALIESEENTISERKKYLRQLGVDVDSYLESDQGKTTYLIYAVHQEHNDSLEERCGRCLFYFMKSLPNNDKNFGCLKYESRPMKCDDFKDTGEEFTSRLQFISLFKMFVFY